MSFSTPIVENNHKAFKMLKHNNMDVDYQNNSGNTALIFASCHGNINVVVELLKYDMLDVNSNT
jgi:ankyrin repeat protein